MEYYSALKRKGILIPTTWMNLEDMVLSEISPSQKVKCPVIPLIHGPWSLQMKRQKAEEWVQGLGKGTGSCYSMGCTFSSAR